MNKRVNEEEIKKASEADLVSYLESKGESLISEGKSHRHAEHNSLFITGNKWYWNSKQVGNYGSISLARELYGMSFPDAVRDINNQEVEKKNEMTQTESRKKDFVYPKEYEVDSHKNISDYLTNERGIDPNLVKWLIKKDFIAEDRKKNIVFKWRENGGKGEVIGADRQGTINMNNERGSFKQVVANSDEKGGFQIDIGTPEKLIVFESPIDLLSYWQLEQKDLKDARLLSMSGLKEKTVLRSLNDLYKEGYTPKEIIMAVDNDEAGKSFSEKTQAFYKEGLVQLKIPKAKDWNDDLIKQKEKKKEKEFEWER